MKLSLSHWFVIVVLAGLFWTVQGCGGDSGDHASALETSQARAAKLGQAMLAYAADNDDRLPGRNWMDATEKYVKDPDAFKSPGVSGDGYGFAFNAELVGKKLSEIEDRSTTPMIFDSTETVRNAVARTGTMPKPARYGAKNAVVFADGTVQDSAVKDDFAEASARLRKIGTAMLTYSSDFDDKLPLAKSWMDGLAPYVPEKKVFHDPALDLKQFGFAFNRELAGKKVADIGPLGTTPVVFSSTSTDKNAAAGVETLPNPGRYGGKNAILYLDGHVASGLETPILKPDADKPGPRVVDPPKASPAKGGTPKGVGIADPFQALSPAAATN